MAGTCRVVVNPTFSVKAPRGIADLSQATGHSMPSALRTSHARGSRTTCDYIKNLGQLKGCLQTDGCCGTRAGKGGVELRRVLWEPTRSSQCRYRSRSLALKSRAVQSFHRLAKRVPRKNGSVRMRAFPFSSRTGNPAQPAVPPSNDSLDGQNGKSDGQNSIPENGEPGSEHHFDPDDIAAKVAAIERQEAAMIRELNHFASLVKETSRAVSERANSTRIEMAKLRKTVQLQQQDELRRVEEVRRQGEEKIKEDYRRMEEMRKAEDARRAVEAAKLEEIQEEARKLEVLEAALGLGSEKGLAVEKGLRVEEGFAIGESSGMEGEMGGSRNGQAAVLERGLGFEEGGEVLGPDAVAVPEKYECVVAHPGALCCTKTFIRSDPARRTAVIDMQTTVQCSGDALSSAAILSLDSDDLIALGVHSLAEAAADLSRSRTAQLTQAAPDVAEKHRGILEVLATGKIVSARPMEPPSTFGHESFVVELLDKKTGKKVEALFKPKVEGDADGWHRAPVELISYELNLMLGMDYVPPVAYRKSGIDVDYRHFDEGAFIYYVPKTKPLKKVPAANWGVSVARLLSDTRVLDVLLNNSDRHSGHFLFGEHWADTKMCPVLIDHAAGFRKEAVVHMEHENAFQTGSVRCVSAKTYLRLRFLEKSQIVGKFSDVLSDKEIDGLIQRKDMVLAYVDKLVAERGYHRTVIE